MTGRAGQRGNGKAVSPYYLINKGLPTCARVPLRGGNSNNGVKDGAFYVNLNNDASNANWNIGASLTYPITEYKRKCGSVLSSWRK